MAPDVSLWNDSALWRPIGVLAALVVVILIGERVLARIVDGVLAGSGGFPIWFPHVRSVGETVVLYGILFDILKFVLIPATLVWLGYVYGRHRAVTSTNQ